MMMMMMMMMTSSFIISSAYQWCGQLRVHEPFECA
jgi:hypothetical protein